MQTRLLVAAALAGFCLAAAAPADETPPGGAEAAKTEAFAQAPAAEGKTDDSPPPAHAESSVPANPSAPAPPATETVTSPPALPSPPAEKPAAPEEAAPASFEELFDAGRAWLEDNFGEMQVASLPPADLQQLSAALKPIIDALSAGQLDDLAAIRPQAAQVLAWLRMQAWGEPYADWLAPRMDFLDMATEAVDVSQQQWAEEQRRVRLPSPTPAPRSTLRFEVVRDRVYRSAQSRRAWDRKVDNRPLPPRAAALAPQLKEIFRSHGVPPEMVWLAEVESSFDPGARSPVGARGLFQLMPATAERFGLRTFPVDERTAPEKNARVAAQYLRVLHNRFGDWPLVLAAFNAGENRVGRELAGQKVRSFDAIADRLPAETRLYVPKVLATVALREGVDPFALPAPLPRPAPPSPGVATTGASAP